jgi:oxygen-dependent protoporphyrinogen oxidase
MTAFFTDIYRLGNRPEDVTDESVDSFLTRRFGADFARKFGSALVHGVYAADSRDLSIRAAFPVMWAGEDESKSSVLGGMFVSSFNKEKTLALEREKSYDLGKVKTDMQGISVYSFKDGLSTLVRAIEARLKENVNVKILTDTAVRQIVPEDEGFQVCASLLHSHGSSCAYGGIVRTVFGYIRTTLHALGVYAVSARFTKLITINAISSPSDR